MKVGVDWSVISGFFSENKKEKPQGEFSLLVPGAGIEPALPDGNKILSLACLPVPPPGRQWIKKSPQQSEGFERETRFELATPTLARSCSTPELLSRFPRLREDKIKCFFYSHKATHFFFRGIRASMANWLPPRFDSTYNLACLPILFN